jgi:hypothetical protein
MTSTVIPNITVIRLCSVVDDVDSDSQHCLYKTVALSKTSTVIPNIAFIRLCDDVDSDSQHYLYKTL